MTKRQVSDSSSGNKNRSKRRKLCQPSCESDGDDALEDTCHDTAGSLKGRQFGSRRKKACDVSYEDVSEQEQQVLAKLLLKDVHPSWVLGLEEFTSSDTFRQILGHYIHHSKRKVKIFPPSQLTLAALHNLPLPDVKVVILGQDPYHGDGQANGLAFSVPTGAKLQPSLRNIYKEAGVDIESADGDLRPWAEQGVLLLNLTLSVEKGKPNSHKCFRWELLTDKIISLVAQTCQHVVFLLWGNHARAKKGLIDTKHEHLILESAHPSPLTWGAFSGCGHFRECNQWLEDHNIEPINWRVVEEHAAEEHAAEEHAAEKLAVEQRAAASEQHAAAAAASEQLGAEQLGAANPADSEFSTYASYSNEPCGKNPQGNKCGGISSSAALMSLAEFAAV